MCKDLWRCFAFKPDEPNLFLIGTDGGEVASIKRKKYFLWKVFVYFIIEKISQGVHGDDKICFRIPDAIRRAPHTSKQCRVQSVCAGEFKWGGSLKVDFERNEVCDGNFDISFKNLSRSIFIFHIPWHICAMSMAVCHSQFTEWKFTWQLQK